MQTNAGVVSRGRIDDDGFEGMRVADVHELDPSLHIVQIHAFAIDNAAIRVPDIRIALVRFNQFEELVFRDEVIEHSHRRDGFADTALASADKHDRSVHKSSDYRKPVGN